MTLANKITVTRFFLIPVFIVFAAYYSESISSGHENRLYRILALATYALASISDAVDGYIARNYNQSTPLGRVLDPIADKLLLLTGVLTLSITIGMRDCRFGSRCSSSRGTSSSPGACSSST